MNNNWTPPVEAVEPVNQFHTLYMRLAEINGALMKEVGSRQEILMLPVFVDLIRMISQTTHAAAQMTVMLEEIRRDHPKLWEMWQRACASGE